MTTPDPAPELAELRAAHQQLADTVDHLLDAMESLNRHQHRTGPGDWDWTDMPPTRATTLRDQLDDFVHHLNTREELGPTHHIPPCWHHHPRTIEDLTALLAAWHDAYQATTGPTTAPIHYRTHYLWPTLTRLTEPNTPLRRCIDKNQHTPSAQPPDTMLDPHGHDHTRHNHPNGRAKSGLLGKPDLTDAGT